MKTYIVGLMAILMALVPVMASPQMGGITDLRVSLNAEGSTQYLETATLNTVTFFRPHELGTIEKNVINDGSLRLVSEVSAAKGPSGQAILADGMKLGARGTTNVVNEVEWDSVWFGNATNAAIFAEYNTMNSNDSIRVDNTGEGSFGYDLYTDEPVMFDWSASVARGMPAILNCAPVGPAEPEEPFCTVDCP